MSEHMREAPITAPVDPPSERGEAIAEVRLLMPYRQLEALEKEASSQGMTIAHLLRRLLRNWLAEVEALGHWRNLRSWTPRPKKAWATVSFRYYAVKEQ